MSDVDPVEAAISGALAAAEKSSPAPADTSSAAPASSTPDASAPPAAPAEGDGGTPAPAAPAITEGQTEPAKPVEGQQPPASPEKADDQPLTIAEEASGHMPANRHKAVLTRERGEHLKELETITGRQLPAERKARAAEITKIAEQVQRAAQYETQDFQEQLGAIRLAEHQPENFVRHVLAHDPRYRSLLHPSIFGEEYKAPAAPAPEITYPEKLPDYDVQLEDGSKTWSAEKQKLVDAYYQGQAAKAADARIKALEEKLGPTLKAQETEQQVMARVEKLRPQVESAKANWPGFAEKFEDIRAWSRQPENMRKNLMDAYVAVVVGGIKQELAAAQAAIKTAESNARTKLIAELNAQSKASGLPAVGLPPVVSSDQQQRIPGHEDLDPVETAILREMRAAG